MRLASGPIGRFEGLFKFALIQQNFGKASIGGARWIGQLLQRGNRLGGLSEPFPDHCFAEMIPQTWIEAFEGDMGRQPPLPEGHWRGLQRTIPASVQTDQGPSGGGSNCVPQSAKPVRRVVPGPLANLERGCGGF